MKNLISAIQFLTILPVGKAHMFDPKGVIPFFPIVGIILGVILSLFDLLACALWPAPVAAMLDTVLLVVLTGAFHLDGLGDSADGLLGIRPREKALEIMKDSRIGVMALAAILCGLGIKWGGLVSLTENRSLLLLIIPAYARGSMLFGFRFMDYGRPGGGTGHSFFEEKIKWASFWGLIPPFVLSLLAGWQGLMLNISFLLVTFLILYYYRRRMGCITGDMLGAMSEVNEGMLFLFVAAGGMA